MLLRAIVPLTLPDGTPVAPGQYFFLSPLFAFALICCGLAERPAGD